jgi:hypothetical protein
MNYPIPHWDDLLLLRSQLSEEERLVQDSIFKFAQSRLAPAAEKLFREEKKQIPL